jgi:UDP-glucose 4-epimerase
MKNILITGNAGYIGGHLVNLLRKKKKYQLHGLDYNGCPVPLHRHYNYNIVSLPRIDIEFDTVIHLAALVNVGESVRDPLRYYQTNLVGTENILRYCHFNNFIFASTGAASGMSSPYGISKKAAEEVVEQICKEDNKNYTIFRFYNVIGSDGVSPTNPDGLMLNLMKAAETGEFNLLGTDYNTPDGTAIRDYVHVNEICHALIEAIEHPANSIENLGHGRGHSVLEMVNLYKKVNKVKFKTVPCPRRAGDLEVCVLDNPSKYLPNLYSIEDLLRI